MIYLEGFILKKLLMLLWKLALPKSESKLAVLKLAEELMLQSLILIKDRIGRHKLRQGFCVAALRPNSFFGKPILFFLFFVTYSFSKNLSIVDL